MDYTSKKAAFILPFFGEEPEWSSYFFKSAASNINFDWILFSDISFKCDIPGNVRLVHFSLTSLNELINKKLSIISRIEHPYKICDFKPAFGFLFSEYLKEYEYWGYCDFDVIFGDIGRFLSVYLDGTFEVISPDKFFYPGHFCLFKNSEKMNKLFLFARNYMEVFSSKKCYCFDEKYVKGGIVISKEELKKRLHKLVMYNRIRHIIKQGKLTVNLYKYIKYSLFPGFKKESKMIDFNRVIEYHAGKGLLKIHKGQYYDSDTMRFRLGEKNWELIWRKGKLFDNTGNEILYYHFPLSKYNQSMVIKEPQHNVFTVSGYLERKTVFSSLFP